jgi:hypothetical protein
MSKKVTEDVEDLDEIVHAEYPWLIQADGGQSWPKPLNGKKFTDRELADFVGGGFEIYPVPKAADPGQRLAMVMNENGRNRRLPPNPCASMLMGQLIVGDVLVCPPWMVR